MAQIPYRLILGSSSPRRKELLSGLGLAYEIIKPDFEEVREPGETPLAYALRNGISKGRWVLAELERRGELTRDTLVISADTIVLVGELLLEKPQDEADACRMLGELSGRPSRVITAFALVADGPSGPREHSEAVFTEVTLKNLHPDEIKAYVATGEPLDKAGSYAIQGLGGYMVARIEGSYSNVVGLPMTELVAALAEKFGVYHWRR